jgi:hypothetical protein
LTIPQSIPPFAAIHRQVGPIVAHVDRVSIIDVGGAVEIIFFGRDRTSPPEDPHAIRREARAEREKHSSFAWMIPSAQKPASQQDDPVSRPSGAI